jgi:chromate transporter
MNDGWAGPLNFALAQWWDLFLHFATLSLLAVGGAISTAGDMQRYLVQERGWLDAEQFNASVAIAQAAPGPNVLFVAVLGFNVAGILGAAVAMLGVMLPSSLLTLGASRYALRHRESRFVKAFNQGLAPLTIGLLASVGTVLLRPYLSATPLGAVYAALALLTIALMLRSKASPMQLIGLGAAVGALAAVSGLN